MLLNNNPDFEIIDIYTYYKLISYLYENIDEITFEMINDIYLHFDDLHTLGVISTNFFLIIEYILDIYISHFTRYEDHRYIPLHIEGLDFFDSVESFCFYIDYFVGEHFDVYIITLACLGVDYRTKNYFEEL